MIVKMSFAILNKQFFTVNLERNDFHFISLVIRHIFMKMFSDKKWLKIYKKKLRHMLYSLCDLCICWYIWVDISSLSAGCFNYILFLDIYWSKTVTVHGREKWNCFIPFVYVSFLSLPLPSPSLFLNLIISISLVFRCVHIKIMEYNKIEWYLFICDRLGCHCGIKVSHCFA